MNRPANGHSKSDLDVCLIDLKKTKAPHLYAIKFCEIWSMRSYFAVVGSYHVFIFQATPQGMELFQHHQDADVNEDLWSCCWAAPWPETPVLVIGSSSGMIKVISVLDNTTATLLGHGDSINEIAVHPQQAHLIFSASKDRSVRLWNLRTMICVAIFAGDKGHKDDVLCVDVHLLGNCMASSSADTAISVWNLVEPGLVNAIALSEKASLEDEHAFKVMIVQAPLYSTTRIHHGYVDSVKWVGDSMLSKSTNHRMVLWTPDADRYKQAPLIQMEYVLRKCDVWWARADVSIPLGIAAIGSTHGKVYLYPIGGSIKKFDEVVQDNLTSQHTNERFQNSQVAASITTLSSPGYDLPHLCCICA